MAPTMVAPDRDTPGISARVWHRPIASARDSDVWSAFCTRGAGRKRSTTIITMPPTMKLTAMTAGVVYSTRFT